MSNVDRSPQADENKDLFKLPLEDIEGLEAFEDEQAEAQDASPQTPPLSSEPPAPAQRGPAQFPSPPATPPPAPSAASSRSGQRRSFSVFWPLILIMGGVLLLLQNLGYLSGVSWDSLWRLWPLLLIALGIDTLFSRRSAAGSVFSALLILALLGGAAYVVFNASSFPWMSEFLQDPGWKSEQVAHPLSGVERGRIGIDWASVPLRLEALDDSPNLIAGTIVYRGRLDFDIVQGRRTTVKVSTDAMGAGWSPFNLEGQEQRWVLGLSPRVPLDLELDGGSGSAELDLRGLELEELGLNVASGAVDLYLPRGEYETWIDGGSGSLDLYLPEKAGVRLIIDGGSGSLRVGERFRLIDGERDGDSMWESDNLSQADYLINLRIDVASGSVRVRDWN